MINGGGTIIVAGRFGQLWRSLSPSSMVIPAVRKVKRSSSETRSSQWIQNVSSHLNDRFISTQTYGHPVAAMKSLKSHESPRYMSKLTREGGRSAASGVEGLAFSGELSRTPANTVTCLSAEKSWREPMGASMVGYRCRWETDVMMFSDVRDSV